MNTPTPAALLSRYFVHLRMNNWSPRTIDRRNFSLGKFIDYCSDRGITCVSEITPEAITAYRRHLFHYRNERSGKNLKFCTQASYLSAVRHFLTWLQDQNFITANPATEIDCPKKNNAYQLRT